MTEPLSVTLKRAAAAQREREGREAVAGLLRRWAERISPDTTFQRIRGRVALDQDGLVFVYTVLADKSDEPAPDGVRLYVKTADHDKIVRR